MCSLDEVQSADRQHGYNDMINCPQCSLILEAVEWNGAAIHVCRSCGGCWIDPADFARIALTAGTPFAGLDALFPGISSPGMFEGLPKPCPTCRTALLEITSVSGVVSAKPLTCARCGGRWLDSREPGLRAIQGIGEAQETSAAAMAATSFVEVPAEPVSSEHSRPDTPDTIPALVSDTVSNSADAPRESISPESLPPPEAIDSPESPRSHMSPMSPRSPPSPLSQESSQPTQLPPLYAPRLWCPQCRRGFSAGETSCPSCAVGLAEASYRVRCFRCSSENTIAADRCWKCHAALHPEASVPGVAEPRMPANDELAKLRSGSSQMPTKTGSCGATMAALIVLAGMALMLVFR